MTKQEYWQRDYEKKANFNSEIKDKLKEALPAAIDALVHEAKHSKNSQARVGAARQVLRLAYVTGAFEKDEIRNFMEDLGAELDQIEIS